MTLDQAMERTRWDLLTLVYLSWVNKTSTLFGLVDCRICEVCGNEFCEVDGSSIRAATFRFVERFGVEDLLYVGLGKRCAADLEAAVQRQEAEKIARFIKDY